MKHWLGRWWLFLVVPFMVFLIKDANAGFCPASDFTWPNGSFIALHFFEKHRDIFFKDITGETVSLESLKGKVVFINFWATWCLPCRAEMSSIQRLKNSLGEDERIVFLMVDVDNNLKRSSKFLRKRKLDLPVYAAVGDLPQIFLNKAIPTTVILDKQGAVTLRIEGAMNFVQKKMINTIKFLIEE